MLSTSGGLGLGLYGPALALASLVAWPGMGDGRARDGYLVNCRAYGKAPPEHGDWVWLRSSPWGEGRLGRIVAGPGQEVEWSDEQLRVEGELRSARRFLAPPAIPGRPRPHRPRRPRPGRPGFLRLGPDGPGNSGACALR